MRNKFYLCVVASFLGLLGSINAATLVNDFSGSVTGYNFTSSFADAFAMSSPSASPTASGATGQVDVGYYTVNYRDMPNFNTGVWSIVNGYSGDMGNYDGDTGFYTGGTYFDLAGVTGFLVSLRKESLTPPHWLIFIFSQIETRKFIFPSTFPAFLRQGLRTLRSIWRVTPGILTSLISRR